MKRERQNLAIEKSRAYKELWLRKSLKILKNFRYKAKLSFLVKMNKHVWDLYFLQKLTFMPKRYQQICASIALSSLTKQTLVPADKYAHYLFLLFYSFRSKNDLFGAASRTQGKIIRK